MKNMTVHLKEVTTSDYMKYDGICENIFYLVTFKERAHGWDWCHLNIYIAITPYL